MNTIIYFSKLQKNGFIYHGHRFCDWDFPYARYHLEKLMWDDDYQSIYDKASTYLEKGEVPYLIEKMKTLTKTDQP